MGREGSCYREDSIFTVGVEPGDCQKESRGGATSY